MFATQSNTHLVLAQELKHKAYLEFYRQRIRDGDTVILDNGAYEDKPVTGPQLLECIRMLKPTYYVLPDQPNNFQLSGMMGLDFIKMVKDHHLSSRRLWVVHATPGNIDEFEKSYIMGILNADGVCFSRLTPDYGFGSNYIRRAHFISHLKKKHLWDSDKYVHALGMLNGNMAELPLLAAEGVHSIDSSAPVWRGLMGYRLPDHKTWSDFPCHINYQGIISNSRVDGSNTASGIYWAQQNLDKVLTACQHNKSKLVLS